jgi:hypothetical protein
VRRFRVIEPGGDYIVTEQEVLDSFYLNWSQRMQDKGLAHLISFDNCIEDWKFIHWAEELK